MERLSEAELSTLDTSLRQHGFPQGLAGADGIFAAVATLPQTIEPDVWLGLIVDHAEGAPSREGIQDMLAQLMQRYGEVQDALLDRAPERVVPAPEDEAAVAHFCSGYLAATQLDRIFKGNDSAVMMLLPFAVLSGELPTTELTDDNEEPLADPAAWCDARRRGLPEDLMRLYDHCSALRHT